MSDTKREVEKCRDKYWEKYRQEVSHMSYMKQRWIEREQAKAETVQQEMEQLSYEDEDFPSCTPLPKLTCEADKPEGTRDVDKYLKEQQDKLWRED
jgi:hypothetical protein